MKLNYDVIESAESYINPIKAPWFEHHVNKPRQRIIPPMTKKLLQMLVRTFAVVSASWILKINKHPTTRAILTPVVINNFFKSIFFITYNLVRNVLSLRHYIKRSVQGILLAYMELDYDNHDHE